MLIYRIFFHCKCPEKFQKSFLFAFVIEFHSVCIYCQDWQFYLFFTHAFKRKIVCCDNCWNRSSNHCYKRCIYLLHHISKLRHQAVITSQDCIHISKSGAENCTFLFKPPWLIKSTDIAGASSGIADHHNTSQFKKY